jgi:beta-phosphoglucomutase-like phosphatase (HAD superfamily)
MFPIDFPRRFLLNKYNRNSNMSIRIDKSTKAFIFDLDGTLVDSMSAHFLAWQKIGEKYGFSYCWDTFYKYAGIPTTHTVLLVNKLFNLDLDPEKVRDEIEEFFLSNLHSVSLIKTVFDVVRKYKNKIPMAIGTGSPRHIALKVLKAAGIDGDFSILVTSEDVPNHKPHPDTFLECAKRLNIDPQYCHVFEDGDLGIEAAKKAGMKVTDVRSLCNTVVW